LTEERNVLGPLPALYRIIVSACALLACVGLGAWLAFTLPLPLLAGVGASIGAGIGVVAVLLLTHDFRQGGAPHRVRMRTPRHH
jgi:uncharacterized membrane protein